MDNNFYAIASQLDKYKAISSPSEIVVNEMLSIIKSREEYEKYYFQNFDKENWFDLLEKKKIFSHIAEPKTSIDGKYIEFPIWWPGLYLVKVADKIPDKVLSVIEKVKTENCSAIDECSQAILKMPDKFIADNHKRIIDLFDKWLDAKFIGRSKYDVDDLFDRLIKYGCYDGTLLLLDRLSKVKEDKGNLIFRFEVYYYKEIIKKHLAKLLDYDPIALLSIIEARLKEAISVELKGKAYVKDYSVGWRPAIEDNPQNWSFDEPRDILTEALRDILNKIVVSRPSDSRGIIERYLKEEYSIFIRLAIHSISSSGFNDIVRIVITDRGNLNNHEIHHEFFKLVEIKFNTLNASEKKQFINEILTMPLKEIVRDPSEETAKRYHKIWQAQRFAMITKYLETDTDIKEFKYLLNDYRDELSKLDHPDYTSYSTSWTGPTSALTKAEISAMTPGRFINWAKTNLQPPYKDMGPSPEGVSRIFQEVVKDDPEPYAKIAEKFIDEKIWPAYLCSLIRGFEEAIKAGKPFELEPIIKFIENPLKYHAEPKVESRHDEFDLGRYSWIRGAIANFIEALVMTDGFALTEDNMNRTRATLIDLIEKDQDPTEESEKQYGPKADNMDYVSYCINSNRGKAMCAFMQHAMRRARMRPEEEKKKEEGKGPFPPGSRMDQYKEFLTKRLDDEKSPSVQSSYGRFLPYLCYLDQDWVKQMIDEGKLFPKDVVRQRFWEAHWQGYIGYHGVNNQLYDWLRADYDKAVNEIPKDTAKKEKHDRYDNKIADHLMIAYWRKIEDINPKGLVDRFFATASVNIRGHAIWFLSTAINDLKPQATSEEWKRLRQLWEYRIKNCKDDELGNFVKWLKSCPEKIGEIAALIKPILPYIVKHFHEKEFLEYLDAQAHDHPLVCAELLRDFLSLDSKFTELFFNLEQVRNIITKARAVRTDPHIIQSVNTTINRLGELGYYEFRDLLI